MRYALILGLALLGGLAIGCEDDVATERSVEVKDDKVITEEKRVAREGDDGVTVTEKKEVEPIDRD
jgi:hypothetical protein